jgi:hypothetical protein
MSRERSPLRDRVVFIVGARRSGTNWLGRILTAHPSVAGVPTESYLFSHGIQPLADRFQHANPGAPSIGRTFVQRDDFLDSLRDLVDRVLLETIARQKPDARYVVERTPWHVSHLPLIADVYPDARVINIIRDGRDVARSLISMPWGPGSMVEAAEEWRTAVDDGRAGSELLGERYRQVKYEELLEDPQTETRAIFDWLDLDLSDEAGERIRTEAGSTFNVDPGSPGVRKEKWRDELTNAELRTFEQVAGDQLERLGYRRSVTEPGSAPPSQRSAAFRGALRPIRETLRRPAALRRGRPERSLARRMHSDQVAHNEVVANFERHVAAGDDAAARILLAPTLRVKLRDGPRTSEARGGTAADELLAALREHRDRGMRLESGETQASPYALTTITTYSLDDGSRWVRTLVYNVRAKRLREVGLHRYRLDV